MRGKKLLSLSIVFALLLMFVPVKASDTKTTDLSLTVSQTYEWSAPASITFTTNATNETKAGTVSVTSNVIPDGKKLVIKISSTEDFKMTSGTAYRTYQVKKGSSVLAAGGTVLEVASGSNTGSQSLDFILQSVANPVAGTFTGTCDFEASIVNAS
jgi:hypothetical protein